MIPQIRIGQGLDVHAFERRDFVTLQVFKFRIRHGLKAHSDGDVVLHALTDAYWVLWRWGILGSISSRYRSKL